MRSRLELPAIWNTVPILQGDRSVTKNHMSLEGKRQSGPQMYFEIWPSADLGVSQN